MNKSKKWPLSLELAGQELCLLINGSHSWLLIILSLVGSKGIRFTLFQTRFVVSYILIRLITATSPPSNRLLSYYQAALHSGPHLASLDNQFDAWISASQVSTRILMWLSETDLKQDESSNPVFNRATRLETLNLLAKPLLKFSPAIITYEPSECLQYLSCLVDLFECCRATSQATSAERKLSAPAHQLADCLLASLSPCILSISRRTFLQHPDLLTPLLEKLVSRLSITDQGPKDSQANLLHFPSILRHLSPSHCKALLDYNLPVTSTTSSAIIAHILLTPGAAAMQFNAEGGHVPTPLIIRIIGFALTYIKRAPEDPSGILSLPTHCRTWLFDLLLAAIRIGNVNSSVVLDFEAQSETQLNDESNTEDDKISWKALLGGGRLAELIRFAIITAPDICPDQYLLTSSDIALLRQNIIGRDTSHTSSTDKSTNRIENETPRRLHAHQLIVSQNIDRMDTMDSGEMVEMNDPDMCPRQHDYSELELGLDDLVEILGITKESPIAEIATTTKEALMNAAWSFDLTTLTNLTKALTGLDTLCTLFLWLEPKDILKPVKDVLDGWENARSQSKKQGKFGALVGWVQGVAGRFGLMSHLSIHLGSSSGFTIHYLSNPSMASPLASLPTSHSTTLASWIGALYGSSGISDDLLTKTDPRIFFMISASIFKQSFDALRTGLIDLETFREGLSYFEQELLVAGCAVGVVGWLVNELSRAGAMSATSYPTALLDILQAILLSDAITPTAISLVAAKSLRLLRSFNTYFLAVQSSVPENPVPVEEGDQPAPDLARSVTLDIERIEEKLMAFPSTDLVAPTGYLTFNFYNTDLLVTYGIGMGWEEALNIGLKMAITDEILDLDDHPYHEQHPNKPLPALVGHKTNSTIPLWSLLPYILKSISIAKFVRIVISGICLILRKSEEIKIRIEDEAKVRNRMKIGKVWEIKDYELIERSIKLAVDIFTWPYEQIGVHLIDPLIRSTVQESPSARITGTEEKSKLSYGGRPGLVGPVLEEVLIEWGKRIGVHEVIEEAELERDIILECLNRLSLLEEASLLGGDRGNENWSRFYRRLTYDVFLFEMNALEHRKIKSENKERGMKMLGWIHDGLMIEDGLLIGSY
ncbi:mediator complex subunit Med5-domain-containing protein [Melampsora americana]|nr:mediator complex subunit Med5-domain-containing protein [Melampsora americana]